MKKEKCEVCGKELHDKVAQYSWNVFKRLLCVPCQKAERILKWPEKLAKYRNSQVY